MIASHSKIRSFALGVTLSVALAPAIWTTNALAANLSGAKVIDYVSYPVTTLENVTPQVMLAMSRDHQYFLRAYNDYTDLNGDGAITRAETTYDNNFDYYGYFDYDKCYSYDDTGLPASGPIEYFVPQDFTTDHYCDGVAGEWSGNFMNWATMTRMDVIRKIIYGGRRTEDKSTHTLLQRAHLPTDGHSFAKYYNGDDLGKLTPFNTVKTNNTNGGDNDLAFPFDDRDEGITICNTSVSPNSGSSQGVKNVPLARVVRGNFSLWSAHEQWQCRFDAGGPNSNNFANSSIDASSNRPSLSADGLTDGGFGPEFQVHVLACVTGKISPTDDHENCKQYPDGNFKPTGLVQEYGEDERIHFGLFTGTYENHIKGGVLRKNTGPLDDEINFDDGTFKADPNSAVPSVGILRALDKFRIYGYDYGDGNYDKGDGCGGFREKGLVDTKCFSWGNPMSEIYAEAVRYFAGLDPSPAFDANDNSFVGGLQEADWEDPLDDENFCAGLNIVMINSSLNSFDHDDTGIFSDVSPTSAEDLTDEVGDLEGITGRSFFVGESPGSPADELCTAKPVNALGDVRGQCPEGPTQKGTYSVAGMAHYAATNDIRPAPGLDGEQVITTFAVQLSTDVPRVRIPVSATQEVQIVPAIQLSNCIDKPAGPPGNTETCSPNTGTKAAGALMDFKLVQTHTETGPGTKIFVGKFYSNYEVGEAGGDFDQDLWGTVEYTLDLNVSPPTIEITTDVHAESSSAGVLYGFILSGTTSDGFHAYSGLNNVVFQDPDPSVRDCSSDETDGTCRTADPARSHTFTVGTNADAATFLPDPLFLAAKYGGFEDSNGNGIPDLQSEWDVRDTSGAPVPGGDGIPDTFFYVTNPSALEAALRAVFDQVIERVASGTAAAVVASEQEGTGAVFQALYDPIKTEGANTVTWVGSLQAIFVDPNGFLREDDGDQTLETTAIDPVIEIFYDVEERRSRLRRFTDACAPDYEATCAGASEAELEELGSLWNARRELSALSNVTTQRSYSDTADMGRHILTWIDEDYDNRVKNDPDPTVSEVKPFVTATFDDSNFGWLDLWDGVTIPKTASEAHRLVNYIRGQDQAGYRARQIDYDADGSVETLRLGDIVNSTPTVQGAPAEAFDILSLDNSYSLFRTKYRNRRNVVYVGANDGMIHAFNAGFFDNVNKQFTTSLNGEVAHPLGSELWAYIPKNLLGHLQWLIELDYPHVFFNDLKPLVFDARIFDSDTTHPNGWGTVLVVGMRLGGGTDVTGITLDTAANGIGAPNDADDVKTKSAYVVMDITDPESPPTVIAELSPPDQYFTASFPAVALVGKPDQNPVPTPTPTAPNSWQLVFGSGPTDLGSVTSTQSARLFAYDLRELVLGNSGVVESGPFDDGIPGNEIGFADTGDANTFVGEFTVSDQDLDMKAEAIYFGTVGGTDGVGGNLFRMTIAEEPSPSDWIAPIKLLDVDQPFTSRPSITIDAQFRTWVIAGTGRLFTNTDKESTTTQTLYGFIDQYSVPGSGFDPLDASGSPMVDADFVDVTAAETFSNGKVSLDGEFDADAPTYDEIRSTIATAGGWAFDYVGAGPSAIVGERTVSNQTLIGGIVLSTAFTPSTDLCGAEGESRIVARGFDTGVVPPIGVFGQEACASCPEGVTKAVGTINLGAGLASSPSIHIGHQDVPGKVTVIVQQSTGAITGNKAQTLGGLNNGEVSWQEFRAE